MKQDNDKHDPLLRVRLPQATYDKLRETANQRGQTVTELIRQLVKLLTGGKIEMP